jgi:hypothetical protein
MASAHQNWNRRRFIQSAGLLMAAGAAADPRSMLAATGGAVSLVVDPDDAVASSPPCAWAFKTLEHALMNQNVTVTRATSVATAVAGSFCILAASANAAGPAMKKAAVAFSGLPESLCLFSQNQANHRVTVASGTDARGIMYAVLELADRVECSQTPLTALTMAHPIVEHPANRLRSINRCFQSDVEDTPWFENKGMWSAYLDMLTMNRFNMFNLSMGLGYDYPQIVTDSYTYFTYPFFVKVPGYERVRAGNLSEEQREKNLDLLRFISSECATRSLDFTLGLWNHAYVMSKGSNPTYPILGLTPETHAPYCRDALYTLLTECPHITGITMRVHGESGIPEGHFDFWQVVFQGVAKLDRKINVNLHAKGTDQRIIDIAQATKMPVSLTPKYWAEHLGLSFQPSSIRETEKPPSGPNQQGALFELTNGSRKFMRYSYGDLFKQDRTYDVYFRIWPGTQRVLLWGDPKLAAGDSRGFPMCGSLGVDLFEPLSFKGRGGSGVSSAPGGRCSYADETLAPKYDWDKFAYSYRVWGRHLYNPDSDPAESTRYWDKQLKAGGPAVANALALASRILRIVTTSQDPSAANWTYWPEIYTNMTIVDESLNTLYKDTPEPRVYGTVSPLDPQIFVAINEAVDDLMDGKSNSRYSPIEVAQWLDSYTAVIDRQLANAAQLLSSNTTPVYRRAALDIQILNGLGKFFAAKIRSAALFAIYQRTGDASILDQAVAQYSKARDAWSAISTLTKDKYMDQITYGKVPNMSGCWSDRLPAIDADIEAMKTAKPKATKDTDRARVDRVIRQIMAPSPRPSIHCQHTPATSFMPGEAVTIRLHVASQVHSVRLVYRHVNQAEYYVTAEMMGQNGAYQAIIPDEYTKSQFALQYYFELEYASTAATMYPGLGPDLTDRPYFLVQQPPRQA